MKVRLTKTKRRSELKVRMSNTPNPFDLLFLFTRSIENRSLLLFTCYVHQDGKTSRSFAFSTVVHKELLPLCVYSVATQSVCATMWLKIPRHQCTPFTTRHFSRVSPPPSNCGETVIRVSNNITYLGCPKTGPKPHQLLSLPPFPHHPLPGKNVSPDSHITAISWMKYYFADVSGSVIQSHFNKGLVKMECHDAKKQGQAKVLKKIKHNEIMKTGSRILVPVSVAESRISKRYDTIPSASLCPNADEIKYLQRLVIYKDPALLILNKPPKVPVKARNDVSETTYQRYWALVIGTPKEKAGLICAPLTKVVLNGGKAERVMLAYGCGLEASQEAVTEYRVLGPTISGCSWLELRPFTNHKHQIRVHCAEALGTPIVGDYKYGWFVHNRWKQMPRVDHEPITGEPYKMRRPEGLDVQKGSVHSKVPLLHLHCRELVIPNVAKHLEVNKATKSKPDVLRFVASMPSHMKISWNLMSSYLV